MKKQMAPRRMGGGGGGGGGEDPMAAAAAMPQMMNMVAPTMKKAMVGPAMKSAPMQMNDRFSSQMYQMASKGKRSKY